MQKLHRALFRFGSRDMVNTFFRKPSTLLRNIRGVCIYWRRSRSRRRRRLAQDKFLILCQIRKNVNKILI